MKDFWFYSMIVLLSIAVATGWPLGLRIAVVLNALVVLLDAVRDGRRLYRGQ